MKDKLRETLDTAGEDFGIVEAALITLGRRIGVIAPPKPAAPPEPPKPAAAPPEQPHCYCGHARSRHEFAGCLHPTCECKAYHPVTARPPVAVRRAYAAPPPPEPPKLCPGCGKVRDFMLDGNLQALCYRCAHDPAVPVPGGRTHGWLRAEVKRAAPLALPGNYFPHATDPEPRRSIFRPQARPQCHYTNWHEGSIPRPATRRVESLALNPASHRADVLDVCEPCAQRCKESGAYIVRETVDFRTRETAPDAPAENPKNQHQEGAD